MNLIGASQWAKVRQAFKDADETFNKDILIWRRWIPGQIATFNEEPSGTFQEIPLRVLMQYNTFRTWPVMIKEVSGEIDDQNTVAILNNDYLAGLGYIQEGKFNFQKDTDYFSHRGLLYKCDGNTPIAQVDADPIHTYLILRVEESRV